MHGRLHAWQAQHFDNSACAARRQQIEAAEKQTLVSFDSSARLRLHTDNPFRQILTYAPSSNPTACRPNNH